uniref:Nucleolar protein 16 n=1 Tax=Onchocerca volvulus TaxID=6282 RepID=A0A8R1XUC6_ONCVO
MRSVKHGRKKGRRRINYSKNLTAAKKKAMKKQKAMDGITCKQMRVAWDKNATIKQNMKAMGLAYDSNKLFSLYPSISKHTEEMEIDDPKQYGSLKSQIQKAKSTSGELEVKKVIAALEKEEMSRDARNIYQDTSKQIQRKIRIFKQSPEYSKYLKLMSQIS